MLRKATSLIPIILFLSLLTGSLWLVGCKTPENTVKSVLEHRAILERSLLWQIDKEGLPAPSFLFGTIHLISNDKYFFTTAMESAFQSAELLAMEFDLEEAMDFESQLALFQQAFMKEDTTLSDLLSAQDYQIVKDYFDEIGIPLFLLERIKPMFLTVFSSSDLFGGSFDMENVKSYEFELMDKAKVSGKDIVGLETMEYQMSIFDSIPYSYQAETLVSSIREREGDNSTLDTLVHYYLLQDLPMLDTLINLDGSVDKYRDILIDNRNKNWIPVMESLMKEKPVFFAIGAGHLGGDYGVIRLLQKSGYELNPIFSKQ